MKFFQVSVPVFVWIVLLHKCMSLFGKKECESLGSIDKPGNPDHTTGLVINWNESATCDGTVTSWHYCYNLTNRAYHPANYSVLVGAYRIVRIRRAQYNVTLVNNSQILFWHTSTELKDGHVCINRKLTKDEMFEIKTGDVLGACNVLPNGLILSAGTDDVQGSITFSSYDQMCQFNSDEPLIGQPSFSSLLLQVQYSDSSTNDDPSNSVGVQIGLPIALLLVFIVIAVIASVFLAYYYLSKMKDSANSESRYRKYMLNIVPYRKQNNQYTMERKPVKYKPATATLTRSTGELKSDVYSPYLDRLYESPASNLSNPSDRYEMNTATNNGDYETPAANEEALYDQLTAFSVKHINPNHIRTIRNIGSGQFGNVQQGVLQSGSKRIDVALKTLKDVSNERNVVKFLQEAALMIQFKHPNIIALLGIVNSDQIILVIEYADNGDLLSFLNKRKSSLSRECLQEERELCLKFTREIAHGMLYLSRRGYIHRDLAARNVVLAGLTCKITDFGLSRELPTDDLYYKSSGGLVPFKWTALEALLRRKYSTASDVWSYGCVLYEIWSLGHKPFEGESCENVIKILKSGHRLAPPPGCPLVMYKIMIDSWNPTPSNRPTFCDVAIALNQADETLLNIPEEELTGRAGELGAPIEEALNMYLPLQKSYLI